MNWKGCGNEIIKFKVLSRCLKGEMDGSIDKSVMVVRISDVV